MSGESGLNELRYPVLCLSKQAGFSVARTPEVFGRTTASLFAAGFYTDLRVVDATGAAHEVVDAQIAHPRSAVGKSLARLFDGNVRVDTQLRAAGRASLDDVNGPLMAWLSDNPEEVEEITGRSAQWWRELLASCADAADIVRKVDAAIHTS